MDTGLHNGNVSGSRDQDELTKRTKAIQDFVNEFPKWEHRMKRHIRELQEIANGIDRCLKGATIANVTGSSVGAVGGVLTLAGIITAPFTAGVSLVLTAVGASIGGAGAATNLTAGITEYAKRSMKQKKVDEIIRQYESDQKEMSERLADIYSDLQFLSSLFEEEIAEYDYNGDITRDFPAIGKAKEISSKCREKYLATVKGRLHLSELSKTSDVFSKYKIKCPMEVKAALLSAGSMNRKIMNLTASIMAKQALSKTPGLKELTALSHTARTTKYAMETKKVKTLLVGTPLAFSQTTRAVTGVLGALSIVWDIYSIAKHSIELSKGSKSEAAKKIRNEAQKMEDALKLYGDICQFLKRFLRQTESRYK